MDWTEIGLTAFAGAVMALVVVGVGVLIMVCISSPEACVVVGIIACGALIGAVVAAGKQIFS